MTPVYRECLVCGKILPTVTSLRSDPDYEAKNVRKTNAARLLDALGIKYELKGYTIGEEHLSAREVAEAVGMQPESVFKTLVVTVTELGPCFAVLPATGELDLKAVARAAGKRSAAMVPLKDVTLLTGYVRGGVTALGAKKKFPVFLDASALGEPQIAVSAGVKGLQIVLAPALYQKATGATLAPLCMPAPSPA